MDASRARDYARFGGVLLLLSLVAGGFGEGYAPSKLIVSADPAETLRNLTDSIAFYRASFAAYLVEAVCDVSLALVFYVLLKPVSRNLALLTAFLGLISTATFAFAELFYFAPSLLTPGASALSHWPEEQKELFTQAAMRLYGFGGTVFMVFYGVASVLRGVLIIRSGYLPRFLGILLLLGGAGFIAESLVAVLVPSLDSGWYPLPMFIAMLAMAGWLLVKGLDPAGWTRRIEANVG
jgi:hypothetical protein